MVHSRTAWCGIIALLTISSGKCDDDFWSENDNSFVPTPPSDYASRVNLEDCYERFYKEKRFLINGSPFVLNGEPVALGEYSSFVAIGWTRSSSKTDYLCGGVLITLKHALTAAHCAVDANQKSPDTVRLGEVDLSSSAEDHNAQQIAIKRFVRHPDYRISRSYHDIALIELERSAEPGPFVCSACLYTEQKLNFDHLTVMGFGATNFGSASSPVLLKADLSLLEEADCKAQFPANRKIAEGIKSSQFCAAAPDKDACSGDSGGPILIDLVDPSREKKIPFVAGIVSTGTGCSDGSMGLYTRVASYIDWIEAVTGVSFDYENCTRHTECERYYDRATSAIMVPQFYIATHVYLKNDRNGESNCGGTLIDYRHVVTSADCAMGQNKPTFILHRRGHVNITKITIHPEAHKEEHNLAILELDMYLNTNKTFFSAAPACLPKEPAAPLPRLSVSVVDPHSKQQLVMHAMVSQETNCAEQFICTKNNEDLAPESCAVQPGASVTSIRSFNDEVQFIYGVNTESSSCAGRDVQLKAVSIARHRSWIESVVLNHKGENT
ncbi:urokinase-type plasminogen activator-like isoform X2 [Armigeres subalbatus]|uniref:urokinase-type plasminogen activator-like isoform X2 n=1 Tax=Armigeres subalbatus TaxID=124917 RepID=UPI002ED1ED35